MKLILLIALLLPLTAWSQTLSSSDPCFSDTKNEKCVEKIRKSIFFVTSVTGEIRAEDDKFLNAVLNKHGAEGFDVHTPAPGSRHLLSEVLQSSYNTKLVQKIIDKIPKEAKFFNRNIFELAISRNPPFVRAHEYDTYIDIWNKLFPEEQGDGLKLTYERYGLPWEDPQFLQGYFDRLLNTIKSINDSQSLFDNNKFETQKKKMEVIANRLKDLVELPKKACEMKDMGEYQKLKAKYGDLLYSSTLDIPECLIKNKQFGLLHSILLQEPELESKYPAYLNKMVELVSSEEAYGLTQFLYQRMSSKGMEVIQRQGETKLAFLQRASQYLKEYGLTELACEGEAQTAGVLGNLNSNMQNVLFSHGMDLVRKITKSKDVAERKKLLDQFLELHTAGVNFNRIDQEQGFTPLHVIAAAGDHELLKSLTDKNIDLRGLGLNTESKADHSVVIEALQTDDLKHLITARELFKHSFIGNDDELKKIRKLVRDVDSDEDGVKALRKSFLDEIKNSLFDSYYEDYY